MSFKHVPWYIWWSVAPILWVFLLIMIIFMIVFIWNSGNAKKFEFGLLDIVNLKIEYAIAQNVKTLDLIDNVTTNLNSTCPLPSKENNLAKSCVEIAKDVKQLRAQKLQLEMINEELKQIQNNLQLQNKKHHPF